MMQAAEPGHRYDLAPGLRDAHRYASGRRFLRQRKMRPALVIIPNLAIYLTPPTTSGSI
jgi:hypothetical protein